ncbi:MAG: hypothetical protein Q8O30_04645 [Candidatus Omnitrophota bacterium]|nr:hypothetical protein [Candidatus Omnitrophota bacterium]
MSAKKIKIKQEEKSAAIDYLKKAEDNYNAVGTLAVQCVISSADAICVYEKGI